jgi:FkbM family methyltransferase
MDRLFETLYRRRVRGRSKLLRLSGKDGFFFELDGFEIYLNPNDYVDWHIINHGYYEPQVLGAILEAVREGDVFWDVGANIGQHSFAVKNTRPDVSVVSFEPNPLTMSKLMRSRARNRLGIEVVSAALSDAEGVAKLSIRTEGNSGTSSLSPWKEVAYDDTCTVPIIRADQFIGPSNRAPNVMKIDVEGHEAEVLRGFGQALRDPSLRLVVFENIREGGAADLLRQAGFEIRPLTETEACATRPA